MVFSSLLFLTCFFPIVIIGYYLVRHKNAFLLVCSLVFYGWSGAQYLIVVVAASVLNWMLGFFVREGARNRKLFLIVAIAFNIGLLGFFKYFNFFAGIVNDISMVVFGRGVAAPIIPLPVGISFFTFQIVSYIIDVYRGNCQPQRNCFSLMLYIMFFPQLIAGPIVRYVSIEKEIASRTSTHDDVVYGIERFTLGLAKKVLISNEVALIADRIFDNPELYTMPLTWLGVLCYTLQIFFDFSGYSDMAIGMGRIFGFHFDENFNYPYISTSIKEFWRRWHISLSSWFRDYVYIPLGGNRIGSTRTLINLLIVFLLTGFWHGAGWTFIVWGLYHGFFLVLERSKTVSKCFEKTPRIILHAYTLIVVMMGWVFFRSSTLGNAVSYIVGMFSFNFSEVHVIYSLLNPKAVLSIISGILFSAPIVPKLRQLFPKPMNFGIRWGLIAIMVICMASLSGSSYNPFIYFRF